MTVAQDLDQFGRPLGRKREVRGHIDLDDNAVYLRRRAMVRGSSGIWRVHAKSPTPPRGRVIYLLDKVSGDIDSVRASIALGRNNQMPAHASLLGETKVRLLAAYVLQWSKQAVPASAEQGTALNDSK